MRDAATIAGPTVKPLDPEHDVAAGVILADCAPDGSAEGGRTLVSAARTDPASSLFGVVVDGELVGAYVMRRANLMNEIDVIAIAPAHRRRGHGRMCLYDALLRSGRRPLVVEATEATRPFYKSIGFKLVGKRTGADGSPRYRMGWHAPMPDPRQPGRAIC